MPRLTIRTKEGIALPACCKIAEVGGCEKPHCDDCLFTGDDEIREIIEKLCRYEETGLEFPKEDEE